MMDLEAARLPAIAASPAVAVKRAYASVANWGFSRQYPYEYRNGYVTLNLYLGASKQWQLGFVFRQAPGIPGAWGARFRFHPARPLSQRRLKHLSARSPGACLGPDSPRHPAG